MPLTRPTLNQLKDRAVTTIDANLPNADGRLGASVLNVLATMLAGSVHGLYGYLDYLQRQTFMTSADGENLDALHGAVWGINRKPATKATGTAVFTGTNGAGLPLGTAIQRADGTTYTTTAEATIALGTATVAIEATTAGTGGNLAAGATLTMVNPVLGINASATSNELGGGTNAEQDEPYRQRLLERVQATPHGGTATDYERWAKEVPAVTRAFVSQEYGAGTVTVRPMTDDTTVDGIPTTPTLEAVAAYLEPLRPVTAEVFVEAPTASAVDFTIQLNPNTAPVRAAVEANLREHIRANATPGGTLLISQLREAISNAAGEIDHVLTDPSANVTNAVGVISTTGTFTFSDL